MQMTHKADLLTEGIVKKLNLLIAADQLTGFAVIAQRPELGPVSQPDTV